MSIKTIRVYHDKGLLPEPDRDASGYRWYGANDAIDLIKIRMLAEAGVPLARIRALKSATDDEFQQALREIDDELTARIRGLRATQGRLRQLAAGHLAPLPTEVGAHLEDLARWGFTSRWVDLQRDLWILVFATHPDRAITLFHDQAETLADPALRQLFLDYDHAHDLDADDPTHRRPRTPDRRGDPGTLRTRRTVIPRARSARRPAPGRISATVAHRFRRVTGRPALGSRRSARG
ncbi:MerR family transcriptional regulator [Streptomyces sp. NPDC057908]|uniref:MerR family transcriptional regulator n=1 Tax=Streptomyces sp. NPDC057908 TaxID=3346276 RepID=UPI0036EDA976